MQLVTTGPNANSWTTLAEANIILSQIPASMLGVDADAPDQEPQFDSDDIKWLVEGHRQISANWTFEGSKADLRQRLAWPRKGVMLSRAEPGLDWCETYFPNVPVEQRPYLLTLHFDTPGLSLYEELASDEIPDDIKEAAVILGMLLKNGVSLFEDNKGDQTTFSLGSISGDNINAVARAGAVFQRMSQWGRFIGHHINKAGGSRV